MQIDNINNSNENVNKLDFYQKYRPMVFDDVIGQDLTVNALRNYVKEFRENGTLPAAIVLAGPAGTGKTSLALIFARALNCPHLTENYNPCNNCDICRGITLDSSRTPLSGFMMRAASNMNGIDDVRNLLAQARNKTSLNKSVFIIDEAQALAKSNGAFDLFLSPVETNSTNTLFIFSTTEIQKMNQALLSRSINLRLNQVSDIDLIKYCLEVLKAENYRIKSAYDHKDDNNRTDDGKKIKTAYKNQIIQAVRSSKGSVRNALTTLREILSKGELFNTSETTDYTLLKEMFVTRRRGAALVTLNNAMSKGETAESIFNILAEDITRIIIMNENGEKNSNIPDGIIGAYDSSVLSQSLIVLGNSLASATFGNDIDKSIMLKIAIVKIIELLKH